MDCSPDWVGTLRRASFRGARFHTESDDITYGRRIKTHEFPNRDRPFQEDLGEAAITFSVTAYVASDNVLGEKSALVAACRRRGAGTLVLPTEGSMRVVCKSCRRTAEKDRMGYIAFAIEFLEAGSGVGVIGSVIASISVRLAAEAAGSAIASAFVSAYNVIGEAPWVHDAATSQVRDWTATVDDARLSANMTSEGSAIVAALAAATFEGARDIAYAGGGVPAESAATVAPAPRALAEPALASHVINLVSALADGCRTPNDALAALDRLISYDYADPTPASGPSATAEARNEAAINTLVRGAALVQMAIAIAGATFDDRTAAIRVRARFAEAFGREIAAVKGEAAGILESVRGQAVAAITEQIIDLRPSITVNGQASLPSLLWAYRLYGDATRQGELARRNRIAHPSFMPAEFEAEAP